MEEKDDEKREEFSPDRSNDVGTGDDFDDFEEGAPDDDFGDFDDGFAAEETTQDDRPVGQTPPVTSQPFAAAPIVVSVFSHHNNTLYSYTIVHRRCFRPLVHTLTVLRYSHL